MLILVVRTEYISSYRILVVEIKRIFYFEKLSMPFPNSLLMICLGEFRVMSLSNIFVFDAERFLFTITGLAFTQKAFTKGM